MKVSDMGPRLLFALLSACATPTAEPTAHVWLRADVPGADIWAELGFQVSLADAGLPECERTERHTGCQVSVHVVAGPSPMADHTTRSVILNPRASGLQACISGAHELGHLLLATHEHTKGVGVMSGTDCALSAGDLELACRSVGVCQ